MQEDEIDEVVETKLEPIPAYCEVYHIMPMDDLKPHINSRNCWCKPYEDDPDIFVHNAKDGREDYYNGKRKFN